MKNKKKFLREVAKKFRSTDGPALLEDMKKMT